MRLLDGSTTTVVSHQNCAVTDDWGYDGINLSWDTSWCRQLASAVADRLGVAFEDKT